MTIRGDSQRLLPESAGLAKARHSDYGIRRLHYDIQHFTGQRDVLTYDKAGKVLRIGDVSMALIFESDPWRIHFRGSRNQEGATP